jgi:hypothetical protein
VAPNYSGAGLPHNAASPVPINLYASASRKTRWSCKAKCQVSRFKRDPTIIGNAYGEGQGPDRRTACNNAKEDAKENAKNDGHYTRHCDCYDCKKR